MRYRTRCQMCGTLIVATRSTRLYCDARCRKRASRARAHLSPPHAPARPAVPIEAALDGDLADFLRACAHCVARAMDDPRTPANAMAGLSRALREVMAELRSSRVPLD